MKNIILIAAAVFTLFSCSKKEENSTPNQNLKVEPTCDIEEWDPYFLLAGEEHNNGMAYLYDEINNNKEDLYEHSNDIEYFYAFAENALIDFINANSNLTEEEKQIAIEQLEIHCENAIAMHQDTSLAYETLWPPSAEGELTENQLDYLSQIDDVIINAYDDSEALQELQAIEDLIRDEISNEPIQLDEYGIVLFAISAARNSLSYWYNNLGDWEILFDEFKGSKSGAKEGWFSWKSVGKEDVKGAVGGLAYAGGYALCTGPMAPGAVAGTALGSAVALSAVDAVDQLFDRWFGE